VVFLEDRHLLVCLKCQYTINPKTAESTEGVDVGEHIRRKRPHLSALAMSLAPIFIPSQRSLDRAAPPPTAPPFSTFIYIYHVVFQSVSSFPKELSCCTNFAFGRITKKSNAEQSSRVQSESFDMRSVVGYMTLD